MSVAPFCRAGIKVWVCGTGGGGKGEEGIRGRKEGREIMSIQVHVYVYTSE